MREKEQENKEKEDSNARQWRHGYLIYANCNGLKSWV